MYYHLPLVKCNTANFGIQPTPSKYRADTKKDTDTSLTYKGSLSDHQIMIHTFCNNYLNK